MLIGQYVAGLVLAVGLLAVVCFRFGSRPDPARTLRALIPAVAAWFVQSIAHAHLCHEGHPVHLTAVISLGTWALAAMVTVPWIRWASGAVFWTVLLNLTVLHMVLCHTPYWTDNPEQRLWAHRRQKSARPGMLVLEREIRSAWHTPVTRLYDVVPPGR